MSSGTHEMYYYIIALVLFKNNMWKVEMLATLLCRPTEQVHICSENKTLAESEDNFSFGPK